MIKISKNYLPKKCIIVREYIKNEIKNEIVIECDSRKIFVNGWEHSQLYYEVEPIEIWAKNFIQRVNEHKVKIFRE